LSTSERRCLASEYVKTFIMLTPRLKYAFPEQFFACSGLR
jgi:hypothetical protein